MTQQVEHVRSGRLPAPLPAVRIEGDRQCTDTHCSLFFLAFLCGLGHIFVQARRDGNLAKLTHGFDWRGEICGVDARVRDRPLLFWCNPGKEEDLTLLDGVCVEQCPDSDDSHYWCPGPGRPFEYSESSPQDRSVREVVIGMARNLSLTPGYSSIEALGYCFPRRDAKLVNRIILRTHVSTLTKQLFLAGHGALESWRFLLGVAAVCTVIGYTFLFILWACFDKLVYGLVLVAHVLLLLSVAGCVCAGFHEEHNIFRYYFRESVARVCVWACGLVLFFLWVLLCLLCCYGRGAVSTAIDSVKATCEVVVCLPTMLLQPLIHSTVVISLLLLLLYGFAWVLSMGRVVPSDEPVEQGGIEIAGLQRRFDFTSWEWFCIAYWLFGIVWIFETLNALGQFAISHAVVVFECRNSEDCFPMLQGYSAGLCCHLGTLAFGGFVVGCLKILAALLAFMARQAEDDTSLRGTIARIACCCCANCAVCIERIVSMVNDLIYTDVALQGSSYMEAASNVVHVAGSNPVTYALIKGCGTFIRVLGVTVIGGVGTFLSYQLLSSTAIQQELDEVFQGASSMMSTSSIMGTTVASAFVCFYIAMAFMMVFYQTTYTLMYCMLVGAVKLGDGYVQPD